MKKIVMGTPFVVKIENVEQYNFIVDNVRLSDRIGARYMTTFHDMLPILSNSLIVTNDVEFITFDEFKTEFFPELMSCAINLGGRESHLSGRAKLYWQEQELIQANRQKQEPAEKELPTHNFIVGGYHGPEGL